MFFQPRVLSGRSLKNQDLEKLIYPYLDGELSAEERTRFENHLETAEGSRARAGR